MLRVGFGLSLPVLAAFATALPSSAQTRAQACQQSDSYVARLDEGQSNFEAGTIFCEGDVISNPVAVRLLCLTNRVRTPAFTGDSLTVNPDLCEQAAAARQSQSENCNSTGLRRMLCFIAKGPADSQFQIFQPEFTSGTRPDIAWESVPDAVLYTIYVAGPDVAWQRTVEADVTSLSYPEDEADLTVGVAHEVVINASGAEAQVNASASKVINVSTNAAQVFHFQLAARTNGAQ
ncbi:MAG: hypothetical protein WA947_08395 [Phormidesmis sp.]